MWQGWVIGSFGVWLVISSFIGTNHLFHAWSEFVVGAVTGILGFTLLGIRSIRGWISFWLGSWLVFSAIDLGVYHGAGNFTNDIILGVVAALAGFSAVGPSKNRRTQDYS